MLQLTQHLKKHKQLIKISINFKLYEINLFYHLKTIMRILKNTTVFQFLGILTLLLIVTINTKGWEEISISPLFQQKFKDYADYTFVQYDKNQSEYILFFGGTNITNNNSLNEVYQVDIQSFSLRIINTTNKPSERYSMCSAFLKNTLYIYGGYLSSVGLSNQAWKLDLDKNQWTKLSNGINFHASCNIIVHQNNLIVLGISEIGSYLQISTYYIDANYWQEFNYEFFGQIEFDTQLWDGTNQRSRLSVENIPRDFDFNFQFTNKQYHKIQNITMKNMCNFDKINNQTLILSQRGIYSMNLIDKTIELKKPFFQFLNTNQIHCIQSIQWLFVVNQQQKLQQTNNYGTIFYYKINELQRVGYMNKQANNIHLLISNTSSQVWPSLLNNHQFFIDKNQTIYLITSQPKIYKLVKECQNNSKILKCFYDRVFCHQDYIGRQCNILKNSCPGSLVLQDQDFFFQMKMQCSGNGVCTQNGCKCFENWGRQDCSAYIRKQCNDGVRLQNWPLQNCQCNGQTVGGNNCEVKFCYNDCSSQGQCQPINGKCLCNQYYTGEDCSILSINFPPTSSQKYTYLTYLTIITIFTFML